LRLAADFGDIPPGGVAAATWFLESTLQGPFIEYEATFEHLDGMGDPRLSLIRDVTIHELIRMVDAGAVEDPQGDLGLGQMAVRP